MPGIRLSSRVRLWLSFAIPSAQVFIHIVTILDDRVRTPSLTDDRKHPTRNAGMCATILSALATQGVGPSREHCLEISKNSELGNNKLVSLATLNSFVRSCAEQRCRDILLSLSCARFWLRLAGVPTSVGETQR